MRECNVLIVGSGPAGASAAYQLHLRGVDGVTVIERMSDERYCRYHRTCGEAVSERLLSLSGAPRGFEIRRVNRIRISCGGTDMDIPVNGAVIDRVAMLDYLRSNSGAEFVRDSVVSVKDEGGSFLVRCTGEEYRCRYLIGADGAFSVVRRDVFGTSPEVRFATVNNLVTGRSDSEVLEFRVSTQYPGAYRWDFPSKDGLRSVGYVVGTDDVSPYVERGIRFIVCGRDRSVVKGNCLIIGDAAMLVNPICYGGIGAAMMSARKAAEAIASGDLGSYQRWVRKDVMFDHHFMDALETFRGWNEKDYEDAVKPFRKGYSVLRGVYAILRRPRWANLYMSIWMAFRKGW